MPRSGASVVTLVQRKITHPVAYFDILPDRCIFYSSNRDPLFEHTFSEQIGNRFPWTHAIHDAAFTLSFTTIQEVKYLGRELRDVPQYTFANWDAYKLFQSELRGRDFVDDFATTSINTKTTGDDRSQDQWIKMWQSRLEPLDKSITIPISTAGQLHQHEIHLRWLTYKVLGPANVRMDFKQRRSPKTRTGTWSSGNGRSAKGLMRKFTGRGTMHETANPEDALILSDADLAPPDLVSRFGHIDVHFENTAYSARFVAQLATEAEMRRQSIVSSPVRDTAPTTPSIAVATQFVSPGGSTAVSSGPSQPPSSEPPSRETISTPPSSLRKSELSISLGDPALEPETTESPQAVQTEESWLDQSMTLSQVDRQLEQRHRFWARSHPKSNENALRVRPEHERNARFYHQRLIHKDQIRLLRIDPSQWTHQNDPVRRRQLCFSLVHTTLADAPEYEALSYCWGEGNANAFVTVDSEQGFEVSMHMWQALRRLCSRNTSGSNQPRLLWIDAICINQFDTGEKTHQVQLMNSIYRRAKRTVIWIGEFPGTLDKRTCLRLQTADSDNDADATYCTGRGFAALEHGDVDQELGDFLQPWHERLEKTGSGDAWWKRCWCVQEFQSSQRTPSVYIATHAITWDHFTELIEPFGREHADGPLSLFHRLHDDRQKQVSLSLFDLLCLTSSMKSSDPRDRIFALLNVCAAAKAKLRPDYTRSVLETFEETTEYLIGEDSEHRTVDVLIDGRVDRSVYGDLGRGVIPTWVPDFTCLQPLEATRGRNQYQASHEPANVTLVDTEVDREDLDMSDDLAHPRTLRLMAMPFDRIAARSDPLNLPDYESSPSGAIIYKDRRKPGQIVEKILRDLRYRFKDPARSGLDGLDRSPRIGRLMLEYLLEGKRTVVEELKKWPPLPERSLRGTYQSQHDSDKSYVQSKTGPGKERDDEEKYVEDHWSRKLSYIQDGKVSVPNMINVNADIWREALRASGMVSDLRVAFGLENLYAFARKTEKRFYFAGDNYDNPMRSEVLRCVDRKDVERLDSQCNHPETKIELHDYVPKRRRRDFFRTDNGFIGLGPASLQERDHIVVPLGASRPFILRECHANGPGEHFTLIGEAVVPGIMNGQWSAKRQESAGSARYYNIV